MYVEYVFDFLQEALQNGKALLELEVARVLAEVLGQLRLPRLEARLVLGQLRNAPERALDELLEAVELRVVHAAHLFAEFSHARTKRAHLVLEILELNASHLSENGELGGQLD